MAAQRDDLAAPSATAPWVGPSWAVARPAPPSRTPGELEMARTAVEALAGCGDIRLEALASGARLAAHWSSHGGDSPVSGQDVGVPNLREIADEGAAAGRVVTGAGAPLDVPLSDAARIVARGVQEWLAYAYLKGYPTPWWLVSGMPLDELRSGVLAGVGMQGIEGLSREAFAYDVADVVSCMLGD